MNNIKTIFTLIVTLTLLASCTGMKKGNPPPGDENIITEISQKYGVNEVLGISFKGKPFVFDTDLKVRKPIKSCKERIASNNPCDIELKFGKDKIPYLIKVDQNGQRKIIKSDITIYHFAYPGSHCEVYVVLNKAFKRCKPWIARHK